MLGVEEQRPTRDSGSDHHCDERETDEERTAAHRPTLLVMTDDELLADAADAGYRVEHDGPVWRVRDRARSWQPSMYDRAALLRALEGRLVHVRANPNGVA